VELGRYLCEVRAGQYWRVEKLKSFDEFLERRFPESRRKACYLMPMAVSTWSCSSKQFIIFPSRKNSIEESHRVLRKSGALLICTVNREWADFNSSAFSTSYLSASELAACLRQKGFDVEMFGAFLASTETFKEKLVSALKRSAVKSGLIPKNMKNKGLLKRIFFGRLEGLPPEVTAGACIKCESFRSWDR